MGLPQGPVADPSKQGGYRLPALPRHRRRNAQSLARTERAGWQAFKAGFAEVQTIQLMVALPLSLITWEEEKAYVRQLIASFAAWAADLPASERSHHSCAWGLLKHSLETAIAVANDLLQDAVPPPKLDDPIPEKGWARAAVAAALLHDCGKVLDIELRDVSARRVWNPLKESFVGFVDRLGGSARSPCKLTAEFRRGRGLHGHEAKGRDLVPVILPPSLPDALVVRILAAYDAFVERHDLHPERSMPPLPRIAGAIVAADRRGSWEGRGAQIEEES